MKTDSAFSHLRRMLWLHREALAGRFPNMFTAAEAFNVSCKTIQRDIETMRAEFALNLLYDTRQYGYYYATPPADPIAVIVNQLVSVPLPAPAPARERVPHPKPLGLCPRHISSKFPASNLKSEINCLPRLPHPAPRDPDPEPETESRSIYEYDPRRSAAEFLAELDRKLATIP